jgi:hypothetical protein
MMRRSLFNIAALGTCVAACVSAPPTLPAEHTRWWRCSSPDRSLVMHAPSDTFLPRFVESR